jgi:hypothetical protein
MLVAIHTRDTGRAGLVLAICLLVRCGAAQA